MAKNIVICCDGTSNEYATHNTNVVKLFYTVRHEPGAQITFYHPGLGTMGPPGAITSFDKTWTRLLGLAIGRGLEDDIRDAYVFLANSFEPEDKVFLFGFSRGAYTARSLAAVVHMYGLLQPANDPLVPYAERMMERIDAIHRNGGAAEISEFFELADGFKKTFSRSCPIWFVGVWDTVSSVGWFRTPLKLPFTASNPDVAISRHAVAIDERRGFFPSNLWRPSANPREAGPKDLLQVWFPGSHSDVGGGYPENESAQSKYPLRWMLAEATAKGLLVDAERIREIMGELPDSRYCPPGVDQPLHESLTWGWWPTEFVPKPYFDWATGRESRRMNLGRRRPMPDGALVHESAYLRGPEYAKRLPPGAVKVQ